MPGITLFRALLAAASMLVWPAYGGDSNCAISTAVARSGTAHEFRKSVHEGAVSTTPREQSAAAADLGLAIRESGVKAEVEACAAWA